MNKLYKPIKKMEKLFPLFMVFITCVSTLDNGLGRTPPMGWMSWERFRCNIDCTNDPYNCISEKLYMQMADHLAQDGYLAVGYEYVNIDDCWMAKERDSDGRLVADPVRFPNGIKKLADYVHSKGLKLGIYEDFGIKTCGGYPGSKFYMELDAQTFADWGVDSLKLDGCYSGIADMTEGYPIMEFYLNKTGRPILYSCSWPAYVVASGKIPDYKAIANSCNIWRNYNDIQDSWDSVKGIINFYGNDNGSFSAVAGPGHFNDPDMIVVGNYGLSYEQQKSQMALWSIMASPLLMSNDLRLIDPMSKALLLNKNVIKINQDPMGIQGKRLFQEGNIDIWTRPILPKGSFAIAVLSIGEATVIKVSVKCSDLGLTSPGGYNIIEVFTGSLIGSFKPQDSLNVSVVPSGVFFGSAMPL